MIETTHRVETRNLHPCPIPFALALVCCCSTFGVAFLCLFLKLWLLLSNPHISERPHVVSSPSIYLEPFPPLQQLLLNPSFSDFVFFPGCWFWQCVCEAQAITPSKLSSCTLLCA